MYIPKSDLILTHPDPILSNACLRPRLYYLYELSVCIAKKQVLAFLLPDNVSSGFLIGHLAYLYFIPSLFMAAQ